VVGACEKHLGIKLGETTDDGLFTITDVECLGSCVNAPVVQRNGDEYYEDLDAENVVALIDDLRAGKPHVHGSQTGRHKSMGAAGATTLLDAAKQSGAKIAKDK
jgi:NADH dehydrogenase (ubiquinone) flavoprotein 2